MSTKTTFKRIALVTVAALGLGVLTSVAPANAATGLITPTVGTVKGAASLTATTVTGIVGNQVAFTFVNGDDVNYVVSSDAKSSIVSVTSTGTAQPAKANGTTWADGATWNADDGTETMTVTLTSAATGSSVVSLSKIDSGSGVKSTFGTVTISWVAANSTDLGSVSATLNSSSGCDADTTTNITSLNYTGGTAYLCISAANVAGTVYTQNSAAVAVSGNGITKIDSNAVASGTLTSGYKEFTITSNSLSGTAKFDVSVVGTNSDGVATSTKTTSISLTVSGDFTAIVLANELKAIDKGAETGVLSYTGTDAAKNLAIVDLNAGSPTWYVESDKGTTAVSSANPNNSSATIGSAIADTIARATGASAADTGRVAIASASAFEKLTIWVTKKNAAGTTITSNKVVVYVSSTTVKSIKIATAATSVSSKQDVTVTAYTDALETGTSYPAVDGVSIDLAVTAGTLTDGTAVLTDSTGAAVFTYYGPQLGGDVTFNANVTGSTTLVDTKTVKLTGDSLTTLINSLIAKINALTKLVAKIQKKVKA
jgi:hypothetical protein